MKSHQSSNKSPNNLSLLVVNHTKSHQLPFNSCWNVLILQNPSPEQSNHHNLELAFNSHSNGTVSDKFAPSLSFPSPPISIWPSPCGLYKFSYSSVVCLGGLGVTCSPRDPRFAGWNLAEVDRFFSCIKILSTSPPGGTLSWGSWFQAR